jgi:branched-subunit amino acid aminotransferase/4-amino-4-deoxychorismate lyase
MTTESVPPAAPELFIEVDGRPATEAGLQLRALDNYGHFTAMQVRGGKVRGLALHLARLDSAHQELFGTGLDGGRVRELLRHALGEVRDASARVVVHQPDPGTTASVMVTVRPPGVLAGSAQSLMSVPYQRPAAHIKHLGGFGQIHSGRLARRAGYDDALLTGPGGVVLESSIANIAFWDGASVVWPDGPTLTGITMALLEPRLPGAGLPSARRQVTLADLTRYRAAFTTNSHGVTPVSRIDTTEFPGDEQLLKTVTELYEAVEWDHL